eukprot:scaffold153800_cov18-Tisochrysis_lutea.AAC.1
MSSKSNQESQSELCGGDLSLPTWNFLLLGITIERRCTMHSFQACGCWARGCIACWLATHVRSNNGGAITKNFALEH